MGTGSAAETLGTDFGARQLCQSRKAIRFRAGTGARQGREGRGQGGWPEDGEGVHSPAPADDSAEFLGSVPETAGRPAVPARPGRATATGNADHAKAGSGARATAGE